MAVIEAVTVLTMLKQEYYRNGGEEELMLNAVVHILLQVFHKIFQFLSYYVRSGDGMKSDRDQTVFALIMSGPGPPVVKKHRSAFFKRILFFFLQHKVWKML
jgi:hypothetical protein